MEEDGSPRRRRRHTNFEGLPDVQGPASGGGIDNGGGAIGVAMVETPRQSAPAEAAGTVTTQTRTGGRITTAVTEATAITVRLDDEPTPALGTTVEAPVSSRRKSRDYDEQKQTIKAPPVVRIDDKTWPTKAFAVRMLRKVAKQWPTGQLSAAIAGWHSSVMQVQGLQQRRIVRQSTAPVGKPGSRSKRSVSVEDKKRAMQRTTSSQKVEGEAKGALTPPDKWV